MATTSVAASAGTAVTTERDTTITQEKEPPVNLAAVARLTSDRITHIDLRGLQRTPLFVEGLHRTPLFMETVLDRLVDHPSLTSISLRRSDLEKWSHLKAVLSSSVGGRLKEVELSDDHWPSYRTTGGALASGADAAASEADAVDVMHTMRLHCPNLTKLNLTGLRADHCGLDLVGHAKQIQEAVTGIGCAFPYLVSLTLRRHHETALRGLTSYLEDRAPYPFSCLEVLKLRGSWMPWDVTAEHVGCVGRTLVRLDLLGSMAHNCRNHSKALGVESFWMVVTEICPHLRHVAITVAEPLEEIHASCIRKQMHRIKLESLVLEAYEGVMASREWQTLITDLISVNRTIKCLKAEVEYRSKFSDSKIWEALRTNDRIESITIKSIYFYDHDGYLSLLHRPGASLRTINAPLYSCHDENRHKFLSAFETGRISSQLSVLSIPTCAVDSEAIPLKFASPLAVAIRKSGNVCGIRTSAERSDCLIKRGLLIDGKHGDLGAQRLLWAVEMNERLRETWAGCCVLLAFMRANRANRMKESIRPLLPSIIALCEEGLDSNGEPLGPCSTVNYSKLAGSKFAVHIVASASNSAELVTPPVVVSTAAALHVRVRGRKRRRSRLEQ